MIETVQEAMLEALYNMNFSEELPETQEEMVEEVLDMMAKYGFMVVRLTPDELERFTK